MTEEQHRRHLTGNVRGDLVGHEGAEELDIEDNRTTALATLVLGGILILVAIATLTQAASLSNNGNAVGPATAPWVIGSLMLIVSVSLIAPRAGSELAAAKAEHTPGHQTSPQDWKRLGLLLLALVVFAVVNPFLGYVVSATLLFGITAIVARRPEQGEGVRLRVHRRLDRVPALRRADRHHPAGRGLGVLTMDSFSQLMTGFSDALTPTNLFLALIGVTLGTLVGVLPGIGPALTVALLLPITFTLEPTGALILFAGIYYGGMYGGSTTAILLNTPGESASMVAALEGNKMARSGQSCVRARHRGHRLLRRRHDRHDPADLPGAAAGRRRGEVHRGRLRRADGDRVRHGRHAARALAAQGRWPAC